MASERNMVAKLTLKLQDSLSGGLDRLKNRLDRLSAATRGIALIGAAFAAISLAGPIREAAAFDSQLRDIAITAGQSGRAVEDMIQRQQAAFEDLALASGQSSTAIAGGAGLLAAAGMDPAQAEALLPIIARVATASGAALNDMASTAFSLSDALNVSAAQMPNALAALVVAGKEGRFELQAMAREFPSLTAAASALGLTGPRAVNSLAAALQIARKGAATESEAANNMANFLGKLSSPETVRNFAKMGVDWGRFMADVSAKGLNPIEAALQKIQALTGGDSLKLGELFGDVQVLNFLRPLLANIPEYQRIRDAAARAGTDVIDRDWQSRMAGQQAQLNQAMELTSQLTRRVGIAFGALVPQLLPLLSGVREWVAWLDGAAPGSIDLVLQVVGGLAMMVTALAVLGPVAGAVAGGFSVLMGAVTLVGAGLAAITLPVAAVIAAVLGLGAAAYGVWRDWDRYGRMFRQLWDGIKATFRGAIDFIAGLFTQDSARARAGLAAVWQGLGNVFRAIWGVVRGLFNDFTTWVAGWASGGPVATALAAIQTAWQGISSRFATIWQDVKGSFGEFVTWVVSWASGPANTAIDAIKAAWNGLTGFFADLIRQWRQPFDDFLDGINRRLEPFRQAAAQAARVMGLGGPEAQAAGAGGGATPPPGGGLLSDQGLRNWRNRGLLQGFPMPAGVAAAAAAPTELRITVDAERGTEVTDVRSNTPGVRLQRAEPNRGRTVGRP